ncbi:hypothetical protein LCGC14_0673750 [marine sediment metagenome]|uniref:Uncharacterized protein n=1 Tax=marine sediment metagenome TaxID=412755 RepID=A0A0F9RAK2_9ZZZZ
MSKISKKLTSSKTFWVNMLVMVGAAVTAMAGTNVVADNPMLITVFGAIVAVVNIALRMVTKVPIQ